MEFKLKSREIILSLLLLLNCSLYANDSLSEVNVPFVSHIVTSSDTSIQEDSSWNPSTILSKKWASFVDKPDVQLAFDPGLWYWTKRKVFTKVHQLLYQTAISQSQPLQIPTDDLLGQDLVSWKALTGTIPIDNLYTSKTPPKAEQSLSQRIAVSFVYALRKYLPLAENLTLPPIPSDPTALINLSFAPEFKKLNMPVPQLPACMTEDLSDIIGGLALKGPYANRIKINENHPYYLIDFSEYEQFPVKSGLERLGGIAYLTYDSDKQRMKTTSIAYKGQTYTEKSEQWRHIQSIFLMTQASNGSLVSHLFDGHMYVGGTFTAVNNKNLSAKHPLRILMHPHQHLTLSVNNYELILLLSKDQFVPKQWSFDFEALVDVINYKTKNFNIQDLDILQNAEKRGFSPSTLSISYPYLENMSRLWGIINDYVGKYIDAHYDSDQSVQNDKEIPIWYKELNKYVPNGIEKFSGAQPTKEGLKKLITLFVFEASVKHYGISNATFNFSVWLQYLPQQVRIDGRLGSIGNHQEYMDTALVATAPPPVVLTDDFTAAQHPFNTVLNSTQKMLMQRFNKEMLNYQAELEKINPEGIPLDIIVPKNVGSAVDA